MKWLTETTLILSPLDLGIFLLIALAIGWTLYAIRGYEYWYKRFHRYARFSRKVIEKDHSYVEHVPEIEQNIVVPPTRPAYVKTKKPAPAPVAPVSIHKDDLQVIEGIGPKIEQILNDAGIYSWQSLAQSSQETLRHIIGKSGKRFQMHDPSTWPKQAYLADTGKWDELRQWQDVLDRGVEPVQKPSKS